ncbi:MAG: hypothetical protein AAGI01_15155 [Myxococcota bacterium]
MPEKSRTRKLYIFALLSCMPALVLSACAGDSEDPEDASVDSGSTTTADMAANAEDMVADAEDMSEVSVNACKGMPEDIDPADLPVVSLEITPDVVIEDPASKVTFTLKLDRDPPEGGTRVYVLGDVSQSLNQLALLSVSTEPSTNAAPIGDFDFSGFTLLMESREVSVNTLGFQDGQPEEPVEVTFRIVPFEEVAWCDVPVDSEPAAAPYAVGTPSTAVLTLRDTPEE